MYGSKEYQQKVRIAWEHFIKNEDYDYSFLRPEILASWTRSKNMNVNPRNTKYKTLPQEELNIVINQNIYLINIIRPYMENLYDIVKGSGSYILLCDKKGRIIDFKGDPDIIAQASSTSLWMGALRNESNVGTNGIGTSIYTRKPIQIWGEEHFFEKHKQYTCSGAPFFDADGNLIGCLNVTVAVENAHLHTLGMVVCAADSITKELKLRRAVESLKTVNAQRDSIIENMTSGIILLNSTARVVQINKNALKQLELSYEDIIGQDLFDYISIDNYDRYVTKSILEEEKYNEEVSVKRHYASGNPKRYHMSINHIKDARGAVTGILLRFNKPKLINKLVKNISGFNANYTFDSIIHNSDSMSKTIADSKKAATSDSNILILGESGTGKELMAQSIHNESNFSNGPFVAINCAAIPNTLMESELFGYEKGSFTGAEREGRPGKFEMADGGTIFLDEIGDMPLNIQAALLRVLQTKEVTRIGGTYPKPVNIRVITATNQDLIKAVQEKTFRKDLYYRLNVITISMPPLRIRGEKEIEILARHFLQQYNDHNHKDITMDREVIAILQHYDWPGNIRELENVIERTVNLLSGDMITADDLPEFVLNSGSDNGIRTGSENPKDGSKDEFLPAGIRDDEIKKQKEDNTSFNINQNEKSLIIAALESSGGNATLASELLGMNRRTFYRKIDKYNINIKQYRI